jgi:2-polyprenyl-3-methyl-5-hydroxy-6-metoxy-1,4-benzoquinol methylase
MKIIDEILQSWRFKQALAYINEYSKVLDVGCHQGELIKLLAGHISLGIGIDPTLKIEEEGNGYRLIKGRFPGDLPGEDDFNVITLLAIVEHVPQQELPLFIHNCRERLCSGGCIIITFPSPKAENILNLMKRFRLIEGLSLEEHHRMDINNLMELLTKEGFELKTRKRFQLGYNNLLVARRP